MANSPPEDLVVYARSLNRDVMAAVRDPQWDLPSLAPDWHFYVPRPLQRLWGRLDFEAKLAAFVVAETAAQDAHGGG